MAYQFPGGGSFSTEERFDFSNPFVAAAIVHDGKRYALWTRREKTGGTTKSNRGLGIIDVEWSVGALSFLQEVSMELQLAYLPKISVTLAPPYREAINFLNSPLMEWAGGSRLEIYFGYLSNTTSASVLSQVYSGTILKPEVSLGAETTITLHAQGVSAWSTARQEGRRTFKGKTRYEMIKTIAEGRVQDPLEFAPDFERVSNVSKELKLDPKFIDEVLGIPVTPQDPSRSSIGSWEQQGILADRARDNLNKWIESGKRRSDKKKRTRTAKAYMAYLEEWEQARAEAATAFSSLPDRSEGPIVRQIKIDISKVSKADDYESWYLLKEQKIKSYAQGGKSDWQAVYELCRESLCFSYWEGDTLKIFPRNTSFTSEKAKRVYRLYDYPAGSIGPANGVFPILSASSPHMFVYMGAGTRGVFLSDCNSKTRAAESYKIDDKASGVSRTQAGGTTVKPSSTYPDTDAVTGTGAKSYPGSPSDEQVQAQAKAEYENWAQTSGVILTIESLADPRLAPGDAILVRGLGERLDQRYVVFKQNFTLGAAGANMTLELRSNAASIDKTVNAQGPVADNDPNRVLVDLGGITITAAELADATGQSIEEVLSDANIVGPNT